MNADLIAAAKRVSWKFGHDEAGTPSDWSEWADLRAAIAAAEAAQSPAEGDAVAWMLRETNGRVRHIGPKHDFVPDGCEEIPLYAHPQPKHTAAKLEDIEQYRMQMAGISTAALGYWKEGDDIHPDYDTVPLRDVAKLYAKYDALYKAAQSPAPAPGPVRYPHPDEDDAVTLWAEIHRLRAAVQGPDGYATWQEAATAERVRRVRAEKALAAAQAPAVGAEVAELVRQSRELCAATLRAGPGVAVEIPAKLAEEGRKFMRGEPSLIEQMPFADVQKLGDLLGESDVPVQHTAPQQGEN